MAADDEAGPVPSTPYQRAVARERRAIELHLGAASLEDAAADALEARAVDEPDQEKRAALRALAEDERRRADRARGRADTARRRLTDEGEDVDWPTRT